MAMIKKISIITDSPALYGFLKSDPPDAVQIVSDSPLESFDPELSLTTEIQIAVDLKTIEKDNFVAWLINRVRVIKGNHKININRKRISVNKPEAVKLILKEIENEEQN
jgi:hypothetical protein